MSRATIIAEVSCPEEIVAAEEWFAKWAERITCRSVDQGCGCCVHIWYVEGTEEAVAALPPKIMGQSEWVESGKKSGLCSHESG
jgi:hypothetical protein